MNQLKQTSKITSQMETKVQSVRNILAGSDFPMFESIRSRESSSENGVSLKGALEAFDMSSEWREIDKSLESIQSAIALMSCPILGVAGMLNSGKSSIVASYLSRDGRQRILRGDENSCGTQRFVFWLPAQWKEDKNLWDELINTIKKLFDGKYEILSEDHNEAHQQYNRTSIEEDLLGIPLISTDEALSNFAILDCPDVQRADPHSNKQHTSETREEFLRIAAPICSAFLFVTTQKNVQDEKANLIATSLKKIMPKVPFHLLVNQVDPDSQPHKLPQDVVALTKSLNLDSFFIAYHYRIMGWEVLTPEPLHIYIKDKDREDQVPAAYEVSNKQDLNPPNEISNDRFLINLPPKLHANGLGISQIESHWERFYKEFVDSKELLNESVKSHRKNVGDFHTKLLEFCFNKTTDIEGNPRIPLSPELINKIHSSMEASAPAYMRPILWSGRKFQQVVSGGVGAVKKLLGKVKTIDQRKLDKIRDSSLRADQLALEMRQTEMNNYVNEIDKDKLTEIWTGILKRTSLSAKNLAANIDDKKLKASTENAWNNMSMGRKAFAGAQGMMAILTAIAAVVLIPIDFGTTAVTTAAGTTAGAAGAITVAGGAAASTGATYALIHASIMELVVAAGVGGSAGMALASISLAKTLEKEVFVPYFSDFFAFACDSFGLPRKLNDEPIYISIKGNSKHKLLSSREPIEAPSIYCKREKYWQTLTANGQAIDTKIKECESFIKANLTESVI